MVMELVRSEEETQPKRRSHPVDILVGDHAGIVLIPVKQISPAKDNPRRNIVVDDIVGSIGTVGILQPLIVVRRAPERYELVCGHRRFAAAQKAGLTEVPALIRSLAENEIIEVRAIENLHREDLAPLDEATAYKQLVDVGYSQRKIADRIGRSQSHISKRLSLLELPEAAQKKLDSGGITLEDAVELTKLKDMPKRLASALRERDVSWAVAKELRNHASDVKRGASTQKLKGEGVAIVDWPKNHSWWGRKERPLKDNPSYLIGDTVQVSAAKHRTEPCHAAAVDDEGRIFFVCTSPSRHATKGKGTKAVVDQKEVQARRARRQHLKDLREAHTQRRKFIQGVLGKRIGPREILELVIVGALDRHNGLQDQKAVALACELLGLKVGADRYMNTNRETLLKFADKGPDETAKVGLGLALAGSESPLVENSYGWRETWGKRHFDFLEARGYSKTPAEKAELLGKAPK